MRIRKGSSVRVLLLACSLRFAPACGQGGDAEESLAVAQYAVIDGEPSPPEQNAIVEVFASNSWCTGVVVAPTLVLTARQCFSEVAGGSPEQVYLQCGSDGTGAPIAALKDPSKFLILTRNKKPLLTEATVVRFYAGPDLDLCLNDVALMEVDKALSVTPMAMRLDADPRLNEQGTLVGWGRSEANPTGSPGAERLQHPVQVQAVGPELFQIPGGREVAVQPGEFFTDQAGCFSDQGAPFISDETQAVVGILSTLEPADPNATLDSPGLGYCIGAHDVFRSLAPQKEWIVDAFVRAGQVPWLEGQPQPAALGASCAGNAACASAFCATTAEGVGFCSQDCNSSSCPNGLQCVGQAGKRLCVPKRVSSDEASSASCNVAHGRKDPAPWAPIACLTCILLGRPRWRPLRKSPLSRELT